MKYSVRIVLPDNLDKKYKLFEAILENSVSRHYCVTNIIRVYSIYDSYVKI